MKLRNTLAILAGIALSCAVQAKADTINITVGAGGTLLNDPSGAASKTQYEALNGSLGNNNPESNFSFLTGVIGNWNGASKTPTMGAADSTGWTEATGFSGNSEGIFGFTGVSGTFDYIVLHYGNGSAGSPGGWWQAFYIGGENLSTLTFTVPSVNGEDIGGISSARFFNGGATVPDGGMTLILLGAALSGVALIRRFVKA